MPQIARSLERFTLSLEKGNYVVCDKQGNWTTENRISHIVKSLTGHESKRLVEIGESFCKALDDLEKTPAVFSTNERIIQAQNHIYGSYLKAAKQVVALLKGNSKHAVQEKLSSVQQRVAALQYRIEGSNGGLQTLPEINEQQLAHVTRLATDWKQAQKLIPQRALSERDLGKLKEACRYPGFVDLLDRNRALRNSFFKWIIRDNSNVQLFVEFPATVARLDAAHLSSRISRLGHEALSILKQARPHTNFEVFDKLITMPFYDGKQTKRFNILDESQIVDLGRGVHSSIKEIFDDFVNKDFRPGDREMFAKIGIANWNCHKLGPWNALTQSYDSIDIEKPQWWKGLPVLMTVSKEELESLYDVKLQPGEWLTCAMGARKTPDLDLDNAHGYLKVFIPLEDGSYGVYPMGKFAITFPQTILEFLAVLVSTKEATVAFPDENIFYFFRQHASYPIVLTPQKGEELMALIKKDIVLAREGNLIFQFSGENCAYWVQDILLKLFHDEPGKVPNFFNMRLLKAEPGNPVLKGLFAIFKKAPSTMHASLLAGLARALGSNSGITVIEDGQPVFKTTRDNPYRAQCRSFQPVRLHRKIEKGKFKGVLTTGY